MRTQRTQLKPGVDPSGVTHVQESTYPTLAISSWPLPNSLTFATVGRRIFFLMFLETYLYI